MLINVVKKMIFNQKLAFFVQNMFFCVKLSLTDPQLLIKILAKFRIMTIDV
jgi:hypothetical protein